MPPILVALGSILALLLHAGCGPDTAPRPEPAFGAEAPGEPAFDAAAWDETARLVAGLATGSPAWAALESRASWREHRAEIDAAWAEFEARQLAPMRRWSAAELGPRLSGERGERGEREVLYPFSGPDLIHPLAMLPGRSRYWLLSLEPVGTAPDLVALDEPALAGFLEALRQSLASALEWSFFQTRALRADLAAPGLDGVLPLLLFFAARDGHEVLDVRHLSVSTAGRLAETAARPGEPPPRSADLDVSGVRLVLRSPTDGAVHEVLYFGVDLSAWSVEAVRPEFFGFVAEHAPFVSYLKAASYLMFKPKYRAIERFLLAHSEAVLQDDSGIPWASFQGGGWETRLYGRYREPIPLFAAYRQEALAEAYRARGNAPPLPFTAGYRTRPGASNLLLATRPRR